jgi:hypothetical protein
MVEGTWSAVSLSSSWQIATSLLRVVLAQGHGRDDLLGGCYGWHMSVAQNDKTASGRQ